MLLQLQIFLIIAVLLIAKPAGNAVFLAQFGPENLPYMYILTAVVAALISTAYAAALKYYSLLRVNLWSIGICLVSLLVFTLLIPNPFVQGVVAIGLYLWVALFGVLSASQFWMMANMVFDVRQAKRLFGPIGAGAIAGGITGGYVANIVAGTFGLRALLFSAVGALLPVIFISIYVWKHYLTDNSEPEQQKSEDASITERPHQLIVKSKHLLLLCAIIMLSVVTAKLVDYQFSALAVERYADPDRLTSFFGFWFSTFNVVGFLIQLLLTQRVVRWVGISGALFVLPAGLSLGALIMFLLPGLGAATFSRLVDGSLKQSLHRAGVEMLFLPVDKKIKNRIKIYIDVLVDSLAGGLGGLLLIVFTAMGVSAFGISGLVLVLSIAWWVCVLLVRDEYLDAFRSQLSHLRPRQQPRPMHSRHREVLAGFLQVLEEARLGKSEQQALYVLERTDDLTEEQFYKPIEALLDSPSPAIRSRALRSLALRPGLNLIRTVVPMLNDQDDRVKSAALEYLVTHHLEETEELILEQLKHPSPAVGGMALVHLLLETRRNPALRERWGLEQVFLQRVDELPWLPAAERDEWRRQLLVAAGRSGNALGNEFIKRELNCPDEEFRKAAILATGESLEERWVYSLIDFLSEPDYRPNAVAVLVQYGERLSTILPKFLRENLLEIEDVRRLPKVLEKINSVRIVDLLFALIEKFHPQDLELRLEVMKSLNRMQLVFPQLKMPVKRIYRHILVEVNTSTQCISNLEVQQGLVVKDQGERRSARQGVIQLLRKRQQGNLNRLFRLLGMRYPPADIIPAYRGLCSDDPGEKASALEFMDIMLEKRLKQLLLPVMEYGVRNTPGPVKQGAFSLSELRDQEFANFKRNLGGRDLRLKLAVIYLMGHLDDERYVPVLERMLKARDRRVRDMAERALGILKQ